LLDTYEESDLYPQTLFWIGKALLKLGETKEAQSYLEKAMSADAEGFYGLRAKDLSQPISLGLDSSGILFDTPAATQGKAQDKRQIQATDEAAEREEAEAWLTTWVEGVSGTDGLGGPSPVLEEALRFQRGTELLAVSLLEGIGCFAERAAQRSFGPVSTGPGLP